MKRCRLVFMSSGVGEEEQEQSTTTTKDKSIVDAVDEFEMGLASSFDTMEDRQLCPCCILRYLISRRWRRSPIGRLLSRYMGAIYTFVVGFYLMYVNAYTSCPEYWGDVTACTNVVRFAWVVVFQLLANFFMFHYAVPDNRVHSLVSQATLERFRERRADETGSYENTDKFCTKCNIRRPERCHHCTICQYCVMKRDHHCFMTGGCVGYANQRYFVVFLFWALIGSSYSMLYLTRYLNEYFVEFLPFGFFEYMLPVTAVKWLFGVYTFWQLMYVTLFYGGISCVTGSAAFLVVQAYLIFTDQTMYQSAQEINRKGCAGIWKARSSASLSDRLQFVFGRFWLLNFIFPMPFKPKLDVMTRRFLEECEKTADSFI